MKKTFYHRFALGLAPLVCFLLPACQQEMADAAQLSDRTRAAPFLPMDVAERPLVPGTVARGHLRTDLALFTGSARRARKRGVSPPL